MVCLGVGERRDHVRSNNGHEVIGLNHACIVCVVCICKVLSRRPLRVAKFFHPCLVLLNVGLGDDKSVSGGMYVCMYVCILPLTRSLRLC